MTRILAILTAVVSALAGVGGVFGIWALASPRTLGLYFWRTYQPTDDYGFPIGEPFRYRITDEEGQLGVVLVVLTVLVAAGVLLALWLHRAWRELPDGHRPFPAGTAAWRLLIPGYNAYWLFRILPTYTLSLGAAARERTDATRPPAWLPILAVVTGALAILPLIGPGLLALWVLAADRARRALSVARSVV